MWLGHQLTNLYIHNILLNVSCKFLKLQSFIYNSLIFGLIFIKVVLFCLYFIDLFIKIDLKLAWTFPLSIEYP